MMKRRDAQSNLRGWLALTRGTKQYREERAALVRALNAVRAYRQAKGTIPGTLPTDIEWMVRQALEGIAAATGHLSRAYQVHAAAPHNVREDGHLLNIPDWWE